MRKFDEVKLVNMDEGDLNKNKSTKPTTTTPTQTASSQTSNVPKYQGTSFLDWYKTNYGRNYDNSVFSRLGSMSDVDWEQGNKLYSLYKSEQQQKNSYDSAVSDLERQYANLIELAKRNRDYSTGEATKRASESLGEFERYYNLAKQSLDQEKTSAQQNASIMYDKMKKYLPEQIKAQGLGGLGVSESAMLDAYNTYMSNMGAIASDYQKNKTSIENNYQDNRRSVESERDSAIRAANNTYDTSVANFGENKAQRLSDLKSTHEQNLFDTRQKTEDEVTGVLNKYGELEKQRIENIAEVKNVLDAYVKEGSYEDGLSWLAENKSLFGSEEYNTLYQNVEKEKGILEGKIYIPYGDGQYQIKSQLSENSNEISHNRDFTNQIKEKFGTTNPYDSKIPNGTVLAIKCDNKGKNEVNYEDFGMADVSDLKNWIPGYNIYNWASNVFNFNTRYVVYYNGNWYSADKK